MFKQTPVCAVLMFLTFVGSASAQSPQPISTLTAREFNWLVDEPIIRNRIVTGISQLEPGGIPGQSELTSLITWVSNTLDLPAIYDLPRIERASKLKLATIEPSELLPLPGSVSSYDGMKRTIYLKPGREKRLPTYRSSSTRSPVTCRTCRVRSMNAVFGARSLPISRKNNG